MCNQKKILIVTAVFPPEPVVSATISYDLALSLAKHRSVTVLCPKPTRPKGMHYDAYCFQENNIERVELESYTCPASSFVGRFRESFSFGQASVRYIQEHHQEISCAYLNTWPIFAQYMALSALKRYNIPAVLHIQDIYPESMLSRLGLLGKILKLPLCFLDKKYLSKADAFFAISGNMKEYLCRTRLFPNEAVSVVRNWQDDSLFENIEPKKEEDIFTFMYVGSISPAAGVPFLIRTFGMAKLRGTRLVIAGSGSEKTVCMKLASTYKDIDIRFCDVTPDTVPVVQKNADVLLLPLRKGIGYTASPSKLPAYMFSARPIIACVDPGSDVDHIITESGCGWVCEPENEVELASRLKDAMQTSPDNRRMKGDKARTFAIANFTKKRNLEKMTSVILNYSENEDKGNRF